MSIIHIYTINNPVFDNHTKKKTKRNEYIMDNLRFGLIISHVFITIFLVYNLHPHLTFAENETKLEKQISSIIEFLSNLFRISLYHSSCIIAIWYSRRYSSGMIRATGVLLIGEFIQVFTLAMQHMIETHAIPMIELILDVIYVWLCLITIILTFRLARKISKYNKDLMHLELITTTSEVSIDGRGDGEFSCV